MSDSLDIRLRVVRSGRGHQNDFELDVNFQADPGITILFGPSGSGKSTILQAVAGLFRPETGHIKLGSHIWFSDSERTFIAAEKRGIAYLFQSLALFPHMTALRNVSYGMSSNVDKAQRRARAHKLLGRVGVAHLSDRKPRTFSGGEAQRVALARALATNPRVLLLDEPFSALDRELRDGLATLIVDLVAELQIPALLVTHDHDEAARMGDQVLTMRAGQIVSSGTAADVLKPRVPSLL